MKVLEDVLAVGSSEEFADDPLQLEYLDCFRRFVESDPYGYCLPFAAEILKNIPIPENIFSIYSQFKKNSGPINSQYQRLADTFASAAFNKSEKEVLILDPHVPCKTFGHGLPLHKTIINYATLDEFGEKACGTLYNRGVCTSSFGPFAHSALLINDLGAQSGLVGVHANLCQILNFGEIDRFYMNNSLVYNTGHLGSPDFSMPMTGKNILINDTGIVDSLRLQPTYKSDHLLCLQMSEKNSLVYRTDFFSSKQSCSGQLQFMEALLFGGNHNAHYRLSSSLQEWLSPILEKVKNTPHQAIPSSVYPNLISLYNARNHERFVHILFQALFPVYDWGAHWISEEAPI